MLDVSDITDEVNEILTAHSYTGDDVTLLDLDAWPTDDLVRLRHLIQAALQPRIVEFEQEYLEGPPRYSDVPDEFLSTSRYPEELLDYDGED